MADPHLADYRKIADADPEVLEFLLSRKINVEFDIHCLIESSFSSKNPEYSEAMASPPRDKINRTIE